MGVLQRAACWRVHGWPQWGATFQHLCRCRKKKETLTLHRVHCASNERIFYCLVFTSTQSLYTVYPECVFQRIQTLAFRLLKFELQSLDHNLTEHIWDEMQH